MKITKIKINNYRILQDFEIDLEKDLSLILLFNLGHYNFPIQLNC